MQNCGGPSGGLLIVAGEKRFLLVVKMHKMYKSLHKMTKKVFYLSLIHPLGLTIDD